MFVTHLCFLFSELVFKLVHLVLYTYYIQGCLQVFETQEQRQSLVMERIKCQMISSATVKSKAHWGVKEGRDLLRGTFEQKSEGNVWTNHVHIWEGNVAGGYKANVKAMNIARRPRLSDHSACGRAWGSEAFVDYWKNLGYSF